MVGPKNQQGYTALLSLLLALSIGAALMVTHARWKDREIRQTRTEIEGRALAQFGVGLRGVLAAVQSSPGLMPAGAQIGVDWLKAPACGGLPTNPPAGFLPCTFTGETWGPLYSTTFTRNAATNFVEARTSFLVPVHGGNPQTQPIMAEWVAEVALAQQTVAANGMFYTVWANVPVNSADAGNKALPPGADAGRVLMVANNAPSNDIWLRTDGTNRMLADLNFGGNSAVNLNHIDMAGDADIDGRVRIQQGLDVTNGLVRAQQGVETTDVQLTSIGRSAAQGVYDVDVLTGAAQYIVPKPNCAAVGTQPAIYTSIQDTGLPPSSQAAGADALYNAQVLVTDMGASWRVEPYAIGINHGLTLVGFNLNLTRTYRQTTVPTMVIVAMRKCR